MSAASRTPAEIIRRILELTTRGQRTIHSEDTAMEQWKDKRDLLSCTLVCRLWRPEAQAVLFGAVQLNRKDRARAYITASARLRHQTRSLHMWGSDSVKGQRMSPTVALEVLAATRGVRRLHLSGIKGANGGLLLHSNLGDLEVLEYSNTIEMNETKLANTPQPTYQLRELKSASWNYKPAIKVLTPVFRVSANSLTTLEVTVTDSTLSTYAACRPLVAASLQTLKVTPLFTTFIHPPFIDAIRSLTALKHYAFIIFHDLSYLAACLRGLQALSVALENLTLANFSAVPEQVIIDALATPAASNLQVLDVSGKSDWPRVKGECRRRAIRLESGNGVVVPL